MTDRVHLFDLKERTSAAGNRYLSGWLGKCSVVAFLDREADQPTWQVFVSTPSPRATGDSVPGAGRSPFNPTRRSRSSGRASLAPGELDDAIDDLSQGVE